MALVLKTAGEGDVAALAAFLKAAGLDAAGLDAASIAGGTGWYMLARDPFGLAGAVGLETAGDGALLLRSLAVRADLRRVGLGRRLMEIALAEARRRNAAAVYALTESAAAVLVRFGFTPVAKDDLAEAAAAAPQIAAYRAGGAIPCAAALRLAL